MFVVVLLPFASNHKVDANPDVSVIPRVQVDPAAGPAWFAVDLTTGVTLYDDGADVPLRPASTAKLVTVLTVMRVLSINEQIEIVESDLLPEEFSRMGLETGDVATVEQLLYGALVPSGGDAAIALARTAGFALDPQTSDPIERFVQEMNTVAASIGMSSSSFGNPVGMDDDRSWTTARDLVRAGERVLEDPLLAAIVRTPWASVMVNGANPRELIIENSNQFVLYDDAIGIKTGTTDAAGQNLISAFEYGDHVVVTVVLGSADRYTDTTSMLNSIRVDWAWLQLGGDAASLGAFDELDAQGMWIPVKRTLLVGADQIPRMTYSLEFDPETVGFSQGVATFKLDGEVIAELPIYRKGQPGSN